MGCDINAHIEIKYDGGWMYYAPMDIWRSYWLFTLMAGVRDTGEIEPIVMPRGLPEDISPMTRIHREHYGVDGHSDSWLSSEEMTRVIEAAKENLIHANNIGDAVYLFGTTLNGWQIDREHLPKALEDWRIVFWFDC